MNAIEQFIFVITRLIKVIKIIFFILIATVIIFLMFNFNNIVSYIDALNISYYVEKYDLMPIISGLITGIITFIAMKYIDDLNKKRIIFKNLIEKKSVLYEEYESLLIKLNDVLTHVSYICSETNHIYLEGTPIAFLDKLRKVTFDIFSKYQQLEKYYTFMQLDTYCEWLYRYKSLYKGVELAMKKIKENELKVIYHKDGRSFICPKLDQIITSLFIEDFKTLTTKIQSEIIKVQKCYKGI